MSCNDCDIERATAECSNQMHSRTILQADIYLRSAFGSPPMLSANFQRRAMSENEQIAVPPRRGRRGTYRSPMNPSVPGLIEQPEENPDPPVLPAGLHLTVPNIVMPIECRSCRMQPSASIA
jgi:hypothetical protein